MNNYSKDIHILNGKVLTLEESINLINKQNREIANLKSELNVVLNERDLLLCEVSKLKFELEIADLKRIHDDKMPCLNKKESIDAVNNTSQEYVGNAEVTDEHIDKDITRFTGGDVKHNSPVDNASHGCHMWYNTEERDKLNIIFNTGGNGVKHTRTQNGHANYELSQDLLDKQIELLERKYGGPGAREAAIVIQRAFRRYTLLKKFTHITAMAKAEKRLSRRILTYPEHGSVIENGCSVTTRSSNLTILSPDMKNNCCSPTANMVPVRSLSMREKRIAELENGTNSLPRMYSTAHCSANFNNNYCCNVVSTCSHMCSSVYPDVYVNVDLKKCSNRIELPSSQLAHAYPCSSVSSSSLQSVSFRNYQMEMCSKAVNSQQTIHHYHQNHQNNSSTSSIGSPNQINSSSYIQSQQMCTPTKKVPPEVPKRTSSISLRSVESGQNNSNASNSSSISFGKTQYSGSLSSVQSSSSDSSSTMNASNNSFAIIQGYTSTPECNKHVQIPELVRKRQYRVGLNLFNKKPEKGITYLMGKGFLENSPAAVAKFLIARKGLSKQMIGEYLGNVQDPFSSAVLECFAHELDLSGMQVDVALRKFQTYFRMPGEAQKIERLMEVFSHRYCQCNRDIVSKLRTLDTIFVLAFAIIMLNTDLHTPNLKADRRMKLQDFIKNLRGVDDCCDIDQDMLVGIYERIKANEFKPGSDHVSQVMKVQSTIMGKKPNLAVSYRRLVCYCRLYEVPDVNKKERPGLHQREVFLFNDLLVITKTLSKKKNLATYTYRKSFSLSGLTVAMFQTAYYPCGIRIIQRVDNKVLITFNARNEHDRSKFVADVHESILEMREMENIRIEAELEKQKNARTNRCNGANSNGNDHRDSGVADVEVCPCLHSSSEIPLKQEIISKSYSAEQCVGLLKRSALSNSLIDIHDQEDKPHRCGSVGSLDSGMSVSFQQHQPPMIKNNDVPPNGLPFRKHALH